MTWHCYTHDVDVPARTECPECRADEAGDHRRRMLEQQEEAQCDAERQHEELQRSLSEDAYRRANPGDYDCPHCLYQSLRKGASRCPICHGEIEKEYWDAVAAGELAAAKAVAERQKAEGERKRAAEEAAAAEYIRTAPERQAAAKRAAVAARNTAAAALRRQILRTTLILLPCALALGLFFAVINRRNYVMSRPPVPEFVGVTPAQFNVDYWFCFEADDQVRFNPSDMVYYTPDRRGTSPNGYGTRGYRRSVNIYFGALTTVTAVDTNKQVRFRIWEQDPYVTSQYVACGGR